MSQRSPIFWTRLMAVTFATTGQLLHADTPPVAPEGYKMVPIKSANGNQTYVKVKNQTSPFSSLPQSEQKMFSHTSSFADKSFSTDAHPLSQNSSVLKNHDQDTFITKAYVDDGASPTAPNLNSKTSFPTTSAYSRSATGFDKSYSTSGADIGQSKTAVLAATTTSSDQNRTAVLGGPEKPEVLASNSMANKQYLGPGAQRVPDGVAIKENVIISRMSGLPDRALSIDEVRNLINHETKPNTDVKPEEPSKPLNDPNYKPEPLRDNPSPPSAPGEDDKNDPVPPPGTMAAPSAPENSEPLPQP